jgi:hypothetical protein
MTPEQALPKYKRLLEKQAELHAKIASDVEQLALARKKAEEWITENCKDMDAPDWLFEENPALYWQVSKKSDGVAARCHMRIDDEVIPAIENDAKAKIAPLKEILEEIEVWTLDELQKRGASNFKVADVATASLRTNVKYSVSDKVLFIRDAIKNGYEGELTVTVRPNSKLVASLVEQNGELPSGLSSHKELKAVYSKV